MFSSLFYDWYSIHFFFGLIKLQLCRDYLLQRCLMLLTTGIKMDHCTFRDSKYLDQKNPVDHFVDQSFRWNQVNLWQRPKLKAVERLIMRFALNYIFLKQDDIATDGIDQPIYTSSRQGPTIPSFIALWQKNKLWQWYWVVATKYIICTLNSWMEYTCTRVQCGFTYYAH